MDTNHAIEAIRRLTPEQIHERLEELNRERKALLVLLRAAIAAHRGKGQEVRCAE